MSISDNPGHMLASSVDAEVAKYRDLQATANQMRSDLQVLLNQSTENEMVLQELKLLDDSANVYKMIGPALIKQSADDATETVKKRLEFIVGEQQKVQGKVDDIEKQAGAVASKIEQMQAALQQTTAQAVNAIQAQHAQQAKS